MKTGFEMPVVAVLGDVHGDFSEHHLKETLEKLPRGALIIQVGDFGLGFYVDSFAKHRESHALKGLDDRLRYMGMTLWAIRGNHDNPFFWGEGRKKFNSRFSNLKLVPDYSRRTINGVDFLFVGGATSVDRRWRNEGLSYWEDEKFVLREVDGAGVKVLVTHTAPFDVPPLFKKTGKGIDFGNSFINKECVIDPSLAADLENERIKMAMLVAMLPDLEQHFYGHFHHPEFYVSPSGIKHCCLDIGEMREICLNG